jgi:hypothetical protein
MKKINRFLIVSWAVSFLFTAAIFTLWYNGFVLLYDYIFWIIFTVCTVMSILLLRLLIKKVVHKEMVQKTLIVFAYALPAVLFCFLTIPRFIFGWVPCGLSGSPQKQHQAVILKNASMYAYAAYPVVNPLFFSVRNQDAILLQDPTEEDPVPGGGMAIPMAYTEWKTEFERSSVEVSWKSEDLAIVYVCFDGYCEKPIEVDFKTSSVSYAD